MILSRSALVVLGGLVIGPALAGTAYKCVAPNGAVTYQDAPCPARQKQQAIALSDPSPTVRPPAMPAPETDTPPQPAPANEVPVVASAPLPLLYTCLKATDGSSYLSGNGSPAPYQVPFGMLGGFSQPLGSTYGLGGAGASAPELNRGRVTTGMVASNYVWVQDQCRPLDREETCHALQQQYDDNEHKLEQAFKSERPPFEKREAELQAQLTNC